MKNSFLKFLSFLCIIYAFYAIFTMVIGCQIPYNIKCEGLLLDKSFTYSFSNKPAFDGNLINIPYPQSKHIMVDNLGSLKNMIQQVNSMFGKQYQY
ncbi:MAG: hypothetical protein IPQ19_14230 [Bacteroidetes bacterium]|nr:hypothetical protein [Bacteroidota bacterium]